MAVEKFVQLDVKNRASLKLILTPGDIYSLTCDEDGVIVLTPKVTEQQPKEEQ